MMKAVIFDMDGTIIDSMQAHLRSYELMGEKSGTGIDKEKVKSMVGMTAHDIVRAILPDITEAEISRMIKIKDSYFRGTGWKRVRPMQGAEKILKELKGRYKLAIGTSASIKDVELFSGKFAFFSLFDAFVGREHCRKGKPAPDIYLKTAERLGVAPGECAVVGDSIYDMMAAKAAGMLAIGVTTGVHSTGDLVKAGADRVFGKLGEVLGMFNKPKVSIVLVKNVRDSVFRSLEMAGAAIRKGDRVLIKPNLCWATRKRGTITNPEVVRAVIAWVRKAGGKPLVGDSPIPGRNDDFESATEYGMIPEFRSLLKFPARRVRLKKGKVMRSVMLSGVGYDRIISVPVMKTHVQALVTLSLKNMMGMVPGRAKHELHKRGLHQALADLNTVVRPDISLIDATWAMEGNGPVGGVAVKMNLLICSTDPVAADTAGAMVMGIDPVQVRHIVACEEAGIGSMEFEAAGEPIEKVRRGFDLPFTYRSRPKIIIGRLREFAARRIHVVTDRLAKVSVDSDLCTLCNACLETCPEDAISVKDGKIRIDSGKCARCLCCVEVCQKGALRYRGVL